jgi:anaerobic selenocysteine-containing dehydrogenase
MIARRAAKVSRREFMGACAAGMGAAMVSGAPAAGAGEAKTAARPKSRSTRAKRDKEVDYSRLCSKVKLVRGPAAKEAAP